MRMQIRVALIVRFIMTITALLQSASITVNAQARQSPTPLRVQLSTATPAPALDAVPTATFTPTATPMQGVLLQVRAVVETDVNVRADADPEAAIVGVISQGEQYVVTGRFFNWMRLRYEASPTGDAWVYVDLVDLIGDQTLIPDLSVEPEATTDATVVGATATWEAILLTPGGELTATASGRVLDSVIAVDPNNPSASRAGAASELPTFTPPPRIAAQPTAAPSVISGSTLTTTTLARYGISPVVPIMLLGGLGLLGLAADALGRRR